MGFDIKSESDNEGQLSLLDFQMSQAKFEEGSSAVDYETWALAHKEPEVSKTGRFLTVSATIHMAAILVIAMMTVPLVEQPQVETITFEIEDAPKPLAARGSYTPPTKGGPTSLPQELPQKAEPAVAAPAIADVGGAEDIVVAQPKATAKAVPVKSVAKAVPSKAASAPVKSTTAAKTTFKAVPATIDDLEAPSLDDGALASATVKSDYEEDFNEDFSRVDQASQNKILNERSQMDALAASLADEQESELNALDEENKAFADKMAATSQNLRQKNANAIAAAEASERAAAAHRAEQEAKARAAAQAAALTRVSNEGSGGGTGTGKGRGHGSQGSSQAGLPQGVRSLDQLRQRPGNPHPQYSREERLAGHAGNVAFLAYISKDGIPTQFRMMKSTGYQSLDSKTLDALKKWRFYPGQEGWVELPFNWDLKGGPQEDGGLLRRAVSRR